MLDITTRARGKNSVNKLAMRRINCNVSEIRLSRSEKFHRRLGPTNGSPLYRVNFNINNIFLHLLLFIRSVLHREAYCSCFPHTIYSVTLAEKVFRRFGVQLNQQFHSLYYYPFISFPTILLVSINEITFTRLPLSLSAWYFVHHINKPLAPCAFSVHIHTHTTHLLTSRAMLVVMNLPFLLFNTLSCLCHWRHSISPLPAAAAAADIVVCCSRELLLFAVVENNNKNEL